VAVLLLFIVSSEVLLDLIQTICADALAIEENNVVGVVAEDTCRVIFLQNDAVVISEDLDGVLYLDVHRLSDLDR